jgi:hypothetical protein
LGIAAESLGMTRADWLEQLVRENNLTFPDRATEKPPLSVSLFKLQEEIEALKTRVRHLSEDMPLKDEQILTNSLEQLTTLSASVLGELKLGKRSRDYKLVNKALRRLIELATTSTPSSK